VLLQLPEFELVSAASVEEACALIADVAAAGEFVAGGTDLFVKMKQRRATPRRLVDIKGLRELDYIRYDATQGLRIGALTTIQQLHASSVVRSRFAALAQAAGYLGTEQIRNLGTIGGNLGNASPSAECAPALMALDAELRCVRSRGERVIALERFFEAPGKTVLDRGELITEVRVPEIAGPSASVYLKHSLRRMDVSMVAAAVVVALDGDLCRDLRIALGAVGPIPFRAREAEALVKGQRLSANVNESELLDEAAQIAAQQSSPIDDLRGYAKYRRGVVRMLVKQGLALAISRARA